MPVPQGLPDKRYFTIGEVAALCGVRSHVLRYWEQEFPQLKPMKRRGNRRYYQHHEVLLIQRIRGLLYDEGFTIQGARAQLAGQGGDLGALAASSLEPAKDAQTPSSAHSHLGIDVRAELLAILALLRGSD